MHKIKLFGPKGPQGGTSYSYEIWNGEDLEFRSRPYVHRSTMLTAVMTQQTKGDYSFDPSGMGDEAPKFKAGN